MARAYTRDEVREQFIDHMWVLIEYWEKVGGGNDAERSCRGRLEGLMHSVLCAFDGVSASLPGFVVTPGAPGFLVAADPHPDDEAYNRERGENWYAEASIETDIAGGLHELMYARKPQQRR